jgi:SAM-dependent methyltransferase
MDFDWNALDALRNAYLDGTAGTADYWSNDELLTAYDATFARRIAWKWAWVFRELGRRGWQPPAGVDVVDYGCGTGVAVREALGHWGRELAGRVVLKDRSHKALRFAEAAVRREFPGLAIETGGSARGGLLLASHVLTELDAAGEAALLAAVREAGCAILVEPGTSDASRRLARLREALRDEFAVVAPCTHSGACGMLKAGHERDWCHFHASPPREIFVDGDWMAFGKIMGIDLRSLPLSFLVVDRRPVVALPEGTVRVTGHPRFYKAHALLPGCNADGVEDRRFSKRTDGPLFRAMEKGRVPSLQRWTLVGSEILSVEPVDLSGAESPAAPD